MNSVPALEDICEAGRAIYTYENPADKDETAFSKAVKMLEEADTLIFNSMISNEEAMILQKLKEKLGFKLVNKDARKFQSFLKAFGSVGGKHLYGGNLQRLEACEGVIVLGSSVSADNPRLADAISTASRQEGAYITYMHPLEDEALSNTVSQYIKYEVGSEEGLVAMLADLFVPEAAKEAHGDFFDELDIGYICGESSVGEEEFEEMFEQLQSCKSRMLVVGSDLFNHPRSQNIAKILGMISKESDVELLMIPSELNTLGVALICDLDESASGKSVGYNVEADYTLSFLGNGDLDMPGLSQQEGSLTSLDKWVLSLENASAFSGYRLNDLAQALGLDTTRTTDYTAKLPASSGYKAVAFDDLEMSTAPSGMTRGYALANADVKSGDEGLEEVDEIAEFNGTVIYRCNHPLTQEAQNREPMILLGSKQFAMAAKIKTGAMVRFEMDGKTYQREFRVSEDLKGTIAYNPVFDSTDNYDEYRYKRVKLEEVDE